MVILDFDFKSQGDKIVYSCIFSFINQSQKREMHIFLTVAIFERFSLERETSL